MTLHSCGCFCRIDGSAVFLPQVSVNTHATLYSSTSRTVLKQTFVNPRKDAGLEEVKYAFPLHDGVSVVGFTCDVAGRLIRGVVKEREQAKQDYDDAKKEGQFAGLLQRSESSGDIFTTSLGLVPAGATVTVEITYLGELAHDAEVDGLRYTIPSIIAPRYGDTESFKEAGNVSTSGMTITVDAEMTSAIKSIQSPSHTVSVNIGTTSVDPDAEPTFNKASASLNTSSPLLQKDFVLQIVAANLGEPSALLETHPTLPNHCALMTTLVPKFSLPPLKPEIVFLCDRSGSMGGKIVDLINALRIFLKSLPVGAKFNICSFGTTFKFLWDQSATYTEKSLEEALQHVNGFSANFGGTRIYEAMKQTFAQRFRDTELEVILLTDGQIQDQDRLFTLIREEVAASKGNVRVFTLGVGSGASTALIEGAARAGNGASQSIHDGEKMDRKIMRMLKASLSPHVTDYTLEVKYDKEDVDDFELVEKVLAQVSIDSDSTVTEAEAEAKKTTTSLFDPNYEEDTSVPKAPSIKDKYTHLPPVATPAYLQAPYEVPQLYTFNRTTVYVLMSKSSPELRAKSVVLRGTSKHGPLELEIPIQHLKEKGTAIHQQAARKAVEDLEKGAGWLKDAKTSSGQLLSEAKPSQFQEIVEREAVRLGVQHQVSGKFCSFVAVQADGEKSDVGEFEVVNREDAAFTSSWLRSSSQPFAMRYPGTGHRMAPLGMASSSRSVTRSAGFTQFSMAAHGAGMERQRLQAMPSASRSSRRSGHDNASDSDQFQRAPPPPAPSTDKWPASVGFGSAPGSGVLSSTSFGSAPAKRQRLSGSSGSASKASFGQAPAPAPAGARRFFVDNGLEEEDDSCDELANDYTCETGMDIETKRPEMSASPNYSAEDGDSDLDIYHVSRDEQLTPEDRLRELIALQAFDGSWSWSPALEKFLGTKSQKLLQLDWPGCSDEVVKGKVTATMCTILFLHRRMASEKETWEMVADKGRDYVQQATGESMESLEKIAGQVFTVEKA